MSPSTINHFYFIGLVILNRHFRRYKDKYEDIVDTCDIASYVQDINHYLKELECLSELDLLKNKALLFDEIKEQVLRIKASK